MKSKLLGLCFVLVVLLCSCTSVPKEVNPGDTLVVGKVIYQASGYDSNSPYGNLNGTKKNAIELTICNRATQKEKTVFTGSDGRLIIKGLKADESWYFKKVKLTVSGSSGTYTVWCNNPITQPFMPYDNMVVNLGQIIFTFDGKASKVYTSFGKHEDILYDFQEWAEESEWLDKEVMNQYKFD